MMKVARIILVAGIVVAGFTSCKSQYEALLNSNDADLKYEAAFAYFNDGKYSKAAAMFESLSVLTSGTERDDTVQYYWGLSNYRFRDYYTAETNFSSFVESSTYRYELDQAPTYRAMEAISQYMQEYPNSTHIASCADMMQDLQSRLDTKAFEAARLYYHMEDYLAARVAFRNVLKDNSENMFREEILYYTAMASYKYARLSVLGKQKERYLVFIDDYLNFIGEMPDSPYRKELDVLYKRAQRALGREAVIDADIDMKEKAFAKERKEMEKALKQQAKKKKAEERRKKN